MRNYGKLYYSKQLRPKKVMCIIVIYSNSDTLAGLGGVSGACPPMGPNSFVFTHIFVEKRPRRRSTPPYGKSWIRHCSMFQRKKLLVLIFGKCCGHFNLILVRTHDCELQMSDRFFSLGLDLFLQAVDRNCFFPKNHL